MSEEVHFCPKCGTELENYSNCEGGWCPKCEEWWPSDSIREWEEENYPWEYMEA